MVALSSIVLPHVVKLGLQAAGKAALAEYQAAKLKELHDAIAKQLAKGKLWAISDDKAAAAIWRLLRAASEGVARRNLNLLAEALVSGAVDPDFAPDEFKRQADRLEDLNTSEIIVLAAFVRANIGVAGDDRIEGYERAVSAAIEIDANLDRDDVYALMASLTRTGWIVPPNGYGFAGFTTTKTFDALARLVDLPEAAAEA